MISNQFCFRAIFPNEAKNAMDVYMCMLQQQQQLARNWSQTRIWKAYVILCWLCLHKWINELVYLALLINLKIDIIFERHYILLRISKMMPEYAINFKKNPVLSVSWIPLRESTRRWEKESEKGKGLNIEIMKKKTKPDGKLGVIKNEQLLNRFFFYIMPNLFLWVKKKWSEHLSLLKIFSLSLSFPFSPSAKP